MHSSVQVLIDANSYIYGLFLPVFGKYLTVTKLVILGPILEEIQFRLLPCIITKYNKKLAICIGLFTNVLFTACHVVPIGFLINIFLVGLISTWLVIKTKKIYPSMLLHGLYNLMVLLITL
jgi:membrane protease YdiL (CAAX protease family)